MRADPADATRTAGGLEFRVSDLGNAFTCAFRELAQTTLGIHMIEIRLEAAVPAVPKPFEIMWREPMHEIHFKWNPDCFESRMIDVGNHTRHKFVSRGYRGAPVVCLYKIDGTNTLTFALSDALHATQFVSRTAEDGHMDCIVRLFQEPWPAITEHRVVLRIDRRALPIHQCIQSCALWWESMLSAPSLPVPEAAKTARYCTWYTFHGQFTAADTERQCAMAAELGMGTFGYEAGWSEGMDHEPDTSKYHDFREHVEAIHRQGMPFIAWVSPSLVYAPTKAALGDRLIGARDAVGKISGRQGNVPDPRYPEVRRHLIEAYARIVTDYGVDGLFFDFIECFGNPPSDEAPDPKRDAVSVSEAVVRLLNDIVVRLRSIRPDVLIELRQPSVGPHMVKTANMIRAVDCGNCFADNRLRILDIRMLCPAAVAHADPIMWNPDEPVESAAMQLTHTLFGVPQISMDLEKLPDDHTAMLRTYLAFWNQHRDVLLDGELTPLEPQNAYPVVLASSPSKLLAAVYAHALVPIPATEAETILIVNGSYSDGVVLDLENSLGQGSIRVVSCTGELIAEDSRALVRGLQRVEVPRNGYVMVERMCG